MKKIIIILKNSTPKICKTACLQKNYICAHRIKVINTIIINFIILQEIKERLMYKEAEICHSLQLVPSNVYKFFIKLDILSAHGFSFNGLFISYHLILPENWSTNQTERLFGRTQRCNLNNNSAHYSYATEISLEFQSTNMYDTPRVLPSWPRLLLSVSSLDNWFRWLK